MTRAAAFTRSLRSTRSETPKLWCLRTPSVRYPRPTYSERPKGTHCRFARRRGLGISTLCSAADRSKTGSTHSLRDAVTDFWFPTRSPESAPDLQRPFANVETRALTSRATGTPPRARMRLKRPSVHVASGVVTPPSRRRSVDGVDGVDGSRPSQWRSSYEPRRSRGRSTALCPARW